MGLVQAGSVQIIIYYVCTYFLLKVQDIFANLSGGLFKEKLSVKIFIFVSRFLQECFGA